MFDRINNHTITSFYTSAKEFCAVFVQSKYSFIRAILLSMFVVFLYQLFSDPEYTVSSTIYLKANEEPASPAGAFQATAVSERSAAAEPVDLDVGPLQLKGAARKAVKDLNLHVHYFADGWIGDKELYGESAPIQVELLEASPRIAQQKLTIKIVDQNTFLLIEDGEPKAYLFDQVIKRPFGTFKVMPGPALEGKDEEVLVTFSDISLLAEEYVDRLTFERKHLHPNLLTIGLNEEIPQRGVDFLNRMTAIYAAGYDIHTESYKTAMGVVYDNLDSVRLEMARLDIMLEDYNRRLASHDEPQEAELQSAREPGANYLKQAQALHALRPYLSTPVSQIVIIPENLEVEDEELQELIKDFNQKQLEKLEVLKTNRDTSPTVAKMDQQLAGIQQEIIQRADAVQEHNEQSLALVEQPEVSAEAVVASMKEERQAKKAQFEYLLQRREELNGLLSSSKHKLLTIHKPEDNIERKSFFKNYVLAFLFGLSVPLFLIKVLKW